MPEDSSKRLIQYTPIGVIRSPFKDIQGMPIQPTGATGIDGTVEIEPRYIAGLGDLDGFSHIILLYHFHRVKGYAMKVKPFMDDRSHGVFATRAPRRPNPLGLSVVRLIGVQGCTLNIQDVDILDNTPLLDIKPFVPEFDARQAVRIGWLKEKATEAGKVKADNRFNAD